MATSPTAIRFDETEKTALRELATRLQRNQSDTLRQLVLGAWEVMKENDAKTQEANNQHEKRPGTP
jgi:hypothetical protein